MQPDIAGNKSQPTWKPEIEVPMFARGNVGRRCCFLRLQFHWAGHHTADNCEQRPCKEKQCSHGVDLMVAEAEILEKLIGYYSLMILEPWRPRPHKLSFPGSFTLTIPNSAPVVYRTKVQSRVTLVQRRPAAASAGVINLRHLNDPFPDPKETGLSMKK